MNPNAKLKIRFSINYKTDFGDSVYLFGGHRDLGHWKHAKAVRLDWHNVEIPKIYSNSLGKQLEQESSI